MSNFHVIPAIELRGGLGLRYEFIGVGTRANRVDPVEMAKEYAAAGAPLIQVYNLDGPFVVSSMEHAGSVLAGAERNLTVVGEMARALSVPVQLSGGIRDAESFRIVSQLGVQRIAIGSAAMRDPVLVRQAVEINADALVVFVDVQSGRVVSQSWVDAPNASVTDVAEALKDAGVRHIIYQDVAADAAGTGPRAQDATGAGEIGLNVMVMGGVQTLEHIRAVAATKGISGVIVGKPLSLGEFTYAQAVEAAQEGLKARE
jgi:phosphoribosylformimino-5-aminoimidazole carboxamide ribotide isomerase